MNKRLRFSLRGLFVVTTLVAMGAYWWFALPTVRAKRFITAIEQKQFDVADNMFSEVKSRFLVELSEQHDNFEANARIERRIHSNNWFGDRVIIIDLNHGPGYPNRKFSVNIFSTSFGLELIYFGLAAP